MLLLLRGSGVAGGDLAVNLTEHVVVDDIGQGRAQLGGGYGIRVSDGPAQAQLVVAGTLLVSKTESIRVKDADTSFVERRSPETILVRDAVSALLLGPPAATALAFSIDVGLGGTLRDLMVTQANSKGCWPLSELVSPQARDITSNRHHGVWGGTGTIRGVVLDVPEGLLGATFNGSGGVTVADSEDLSLPAGDMDIAFLMQTTHVSATERVIVSKRDASGNNGYYVGHVGGAVRFKLAVGGTVVFDFTRGSVSDGQLNDVHCLYDTTAHEARIFIKGSQAGSSVPTPSIDPIYAAGTSLQIAYNDPAGASGFIGTLGMLMVGREGVATLSGRMNAARQWTSLTALGDVRMRDPIECSYGIQSSNLWDLVASTGTLTFTLDNSEANSARLIGLYSVGHPFCLPGFATGIPARLTITSEGVTYYKFRGRIASANPVAGVKRSRAVLVTCVDWMDVAARSYYGELATMVGQRSDTVLSAVIDQASSTPAKVNLGVGSQTFAYAIDAGQAERQPVLSELARIASSEFGYLFPRGDTVQGGVLTFVPRFARQASAVLATTLTDTMLELDAAMSTEDVLNVIKGTIYPPTIDPAATTVLFTLLCDAINTHVVQPLETVIIEGPYTDPNDRPTRVGGTAMVTPAATTDYTANSMANGSGTNLTTSMTVSAAEGATLVRAFITNTGGVPFYITKFQVRGKGVYRLVDTPVEARDEDSVRQYGERTLQIDMPYQGGLIAARGVANEIKARYAQPMMRAKSVTFFAQKDAVTMLDACAREPGDRIGIVETATGLTAGDGVYINAVHLTIRAAGLMTCQWTLAPSWPATLLLSYTGPISDVHDFAGGPLSLTAPGDYTLTYNRLGDVIKVRGVAGGGGGGQGSADSTNQAGAGGGGAGVSQIAGVDVPVTSTIYSVKVGSGGGNNTAGGITEYRIPTLSVHLQLPGGNAGAAAVGATRGLGGAQASGGVGAGNVAGTAGGNGGQEGGAQNGVDNASGAAGGGGGGDSPTNGGRGGNGIDQAGGANNGVGLAGSDASGRGGQSGSPAGGGGGGGGGGVSMGGVFAGGGGGGGAGAQATAGDGGKGGDGVITLTKV